MHLVKATYDGRYLVLDEPIELPPNTRVTLTVHPEDPESESMEKALALSPPVDDDGQPRKRSFADAVVRYRIKGPPDWSERVDDYLYGEIDDEDLNTG